MLLHKCSISESIEDIRSLMNASLLIHSQMVILVEVNEEIMAFKTCS